MNIDVIIQNHDKLEKELLAALVTMERSDKVRTVRQAIEKNQHDCPHISTEYDWQPNNGHCPYCGAKLEGRS